MEILSLLVSLAFGGLELRGPVADSIDYQDLLGKTIDSQLVDTICFRILSRMEQKGFPLASARLVSVDDTGKCLFAVEPGPLVLIQDIKPGSRALRFLFKDNIGLPYSRDRIKASLDRAQSFGFGKMSVAGFEPGPGGFTLLLDHANNGRLAAFGSAGYDPETGSLLGFIRIKGENIAGTGRSARIEWQRISLLNQEFALSYREPWVFNTWVWLELGGSYGFAESLFTNWEVFYKLILPFSGKTELWLGNSKRFDKDLGTQQEISSLYLIAGARWFNARPEIFPFRGFDLSAQQRAGSGFFKTRAQVKAWVPVRFVSFGLGARAGRIASSRQVLQSEMFCLGGPEPPRGYAPQRLFTDQYQVFWLELALAFSVSPFAFVDYYPSVELESDLSWGAGLRVQSQNLGVELFYAKANAPREAGVLQIQILGFY